MGFSNSLGRLCFSELRPPKRFLGKTWVEYVDIDHTLSIIERLGKGSCWPPIKTGCVDHWSHQKMSKRAATNCVIQPGEMSSNYQLTWRLQWCPLGTVSPFHNATVPFVDKCLVCRIQGAFCMCPACSSNVTVCHRCCASIWHVFSALMAVLAFSACLLCMEKHIFSALRWLLRLSAHALLPLYSFSAVHVNEFSQLWGGCCAFHAFLASTKNTLDKGCLDIIMWGFGFHGFLFWN